MKTIITKSFEKLSSDLMEHPPIGTVDRDIFKSRNDSVLSPKKKKKKKKKKIYQLNTIVDDVDMNDFPRI